MPRPRETSDPVSAAIARHAKAGYFTEEAQQAIFTAYAGAYDEEAEAGRIRALALEARARGCGVCALVGGLGFAGFGLAVLGGASRAVFDLARAREAVEALAASCERAGVETEAVYRAIEELRALTDADRAPEALLDGALSRLQNAIIDSHLPGRVHAALAREVPSASRDQVLALVTGEQRTSRLLLRHLLSIRAAFRRAPREDAWVTLPIQRLSRTSGPKIPLANRGIWPFDGENAGLDAKLADAVSRRTLLATPSRAPLEVADQVIVSMRLFVEVDDAGRAKVHFDELFDELRDMAPHVAIGVAHARAQGRAYAIHVLTTQAAGISRNRIITRLVEEMNRSAPAKALGRTFEAGRDFLWNFTPSRVAPGDTWQDTIRGFYQLIGPANRASGLAAFDFFSCISVEGCHIFKRPEEAEQTKTFENTHDDMNIAAVNSAAMLSSMAGTNAFEMARQINTRANRRARDPGNGVGGYCYPKDPYFMLYSPEEIYTTAESLLDRALAASVKHAMRMYVHSRKVNDFMPYLMVAILYQALDEAGLSPEKARVALFGIAYKENTDDTRLSPSFDNVAALIGWKNRLNKLPEWAQKAAAAAGVGETAVRTLALHDPYARRWEELREMAVAVREGREPLRRWEALYRQGIEEDGLIAATGADALLLAVKHRPTRRLLADLPALARVMGRGKVIVDGRNLLDDDAVKRWLALGGSYAAVGKGPAYVRVLREEMEAERALAQAFLGSISEAPGSPAAEETFAALKAGVHLSDRLEAARSGPLSRADALRELARARSAAQVSYRAWLAVGGEYVVIDRARHEPLAGEAIMARFTAAGVNRASARPATHPTAGPVVP
ncbi:MAG: hypothetical protein HY719_17210 [Planctomycetes bacterium]|nr:hypothetical protein [Planctomycetota bacterium]